MVIDGGPAFPVSTRPCEQEVGYGHQDQMTTWQYGGMTLRDYFAAKAMQGMMSNVQEFSIRTYDEIAQAAYAHADAMIKARDVADKSKDIK